MRNRARIFLSLLLIVTAGLGAGASAQSWTFRTPMPTPRWGVAVAVLGGKVYVMGGQAENGAVLDVVERYDPDTDTWETLPRMDDERFNAAAVVFGGRIYVLGGRDKDGDVKDDVQVYDPATGLWSPAAELEEKREGASATLLNGTIFVVGGSDENAQILNDVERLDTTSGLWSEEQNWELDVPRASHATVTLGGVAYTVGGFSTSGPRGPIQLYDGSGVETLGASLDPPRGGLAAAALGGEIYALGGRSATNQVIATVNVYDPGTDTWRTAASLNTPREGLAAASVGGVLYVFGGRDDAGNVLASVEMLGGNSAPAALDDEAATNEDAAVTINVLVNDSDPDGDALTITSFTQPLNGVVVQTGDESLQYTPEADFFGEDTFLYTVSDGTTTATATVTVTVAAVNDVPTFTSTPVTEAERNTPYTYAVAATDVDGDALTITAPTLPAWLALTDHGDGTASLEGTPADADVGEHPVVLRLSDGLVSVDQSFTVTVTTTNTAPSALKDEAATDEDVAVEIDALANDSDPDGDALTITAVTSPAHGTAEVIDGGARIRYTPAPDFFGEDTFLYTLSDGTTTATGIVAVTVAAVNDVPAFTSTPVTGAVTGETYTYAAAATDVDGDALTITAPTLPAWLALTDHGDGTASLEGTPADADVGDHPVVLRLSDGLVSVDQSFTVTVTATNAAPVALDDEVATDEDVAVEIDALANDSDPDGDALTITAVTDPAHGTAEIITGGTQIRYTPETDFFGEDAFTYTADDGFGGAATATVTVTIAAVNDAPSPPMLTTPEDGAVVLIEGNPDDLLLIAWTSVEDPEGDAVTYAWELAASSGFDEVLRREDAGTATQAEIEMGDVAALLTAQGVGLDETVTLYHRVVASDGSAETPGAAFSVMLTRGSIVGVASEEATPAVLALAQNYPNPFAGTTRIAFEVPFGERDAVRLSIFDLQGRRVATLMQRPLPPGRHEVTWNGRADDGRPLASGLYLYRLEHGARRIVKTMTLIR